MSVEQAIYSYTKAGAYASFEEHIKGSLEVGKLADFVILSEDVLDLGSQLTSEWALDHTREKIRNAHVDMTVVGGRIVYRRTS